MDTDSLDGNKYNNHHQDNLMSMKIYYDENITQA